MSGTLYDVPHILGLSALNQPRDFADVTKAFVEIERWGNTIPWWPPAITSVSLTPTINVNTAGYATITNLAATVTPTRVGQLFVAIVNMRANRTAGTDILVYRALIDGVATGQEWILQNQQFAQGVGVATFAAADLDPITVQIQGRTSATTWQILTESSVTVVAL